MKTKILIILFAVGLLYKPAYAVDIDYFPIINLNYDTAQGLGMDLGAVIGPNDSQGLVLSIEPGAFGTKYHLGYGRITAAGVGAIEAFRVSFTGLNMYQTYGDFIAGRFYSGIEFSYILMPTVLNLGIYKDPITGSTVSMIGFGFGL